MRPYNFRDGQFGGGFKKCSGETTDSVWMCDEERGGSRYKENAGSTGGEQVAGRGGGEFPCTNFIATPNPSKISFLLTVYVY